MGEKVALMVRPGRRMGPLPTGAIFLIAELAEGLTRQDLDAALARHTLEVTDWPADPETVVGLEPEPEPEPEATLEVTDWPADPEAVVGMKPEVLPVVAPRPAPVVPSAPAAMEKPRPAPVVPSAPATMEKPRPVPEPPKVLPPPANAAEMKTAIAGHNVANQLAEKHSRAELVKMAKKAGATFSDRGTKEDIAREIVEAESAKKSRRGR